MAHALCAQGVRTFVLQDYGTSLACGNTGDVPLTGDFDGDGRDGPAVYRP